MFSQACKYGIRAVLYLAKETAPDHKIGVRELAEVIQTPKHFLAKILQQLSKNELISSAKGPRGGFYLTEVQKKAPLIGVIESIDGPEVFNGCILGLPVCSSEHPCPLHIQAFAYRDGLLYQLRHQTIGELAKRVEREGLQL